MGIKVYCHWAGSGSNLATAILSCFWSFLVK